MLKKLLLILGVIACLLALFPLLKFIFDYGLLTEYGKGFIWGKVLLLLFGIFLIGASRYTRKKSK
jgi:multisubunit Na+/H+ antiporter MnhG subunit